MTVQDIGFSKNKIMTGIKFTQKRLRYLLDNNIQKSIELGIYKTELERAKKAISKTNYIIKSELANQWSNGYYDLVLEYDVNNNGA